MKKLIFLISIVFITSCYRNNQAGKIVFYKENGTFDRPVETTVSNFWSTMELGGIDSYYIKDREKSEEINKLLNTIEYQQDSNVIFPLYSIVITSPNNKDTLYFDDTGIGYSSKTNQYFNSEAIYTFLRKENSKFFNQ